MAGQDMEMDFLVRADDQYFEELKRLKEARFRLGLRGSLTLVALLVGSYFIHISMGDVGYYFKKGSSPIELGDLRSPEFDPQTMEFLATNDLVSFENDVIMFDDLQSEQFSFYYSPVSHFVVRTSRQLPDKDEYRITDRVVTVDAWEAGLISTRKAFPWDLRVSFSGQGRVVAHEDLPDWAESIVSYMSNSSGVPSEQMRLLLDGDEPEGYKIFLYLILGAAILMAGTVGFFLDALVRYIKARKRMASLAR